MSKRSGIMLCYPFDEKRLAKWQPPYYVQPKYDGERCRISISEMDIELLDKQVTKIKLISSEANLFVASPHINSELNILFSLIKGWLPLDGELYRHGWSFDEIHSVVSRKVNLHPKYKEIEFHIFDIQDSTRTQRDRTKTLEILREYVKDLPHIKVSPTVLCSDLFDVMGCLHTFYNDFGFEGIVVRRQDGYYVQKRVNTIMKFKPRKTDSYKIVGYQEEIDKNNHKKCSLGAFIVSDPEGNTFGVGSGFTQEQRINYWAIRDTLIGKMLVIKYQNITEKGVPRFPVFDSLVVTEKDMEYTYGGES